ncbi:LuxR C-terminal-related transcriptional regulator [uncultured Sulfitobacter sp.]|uniref:LuxR C-terminal-related transcriptional regulator n=1 Tax=uncultured Sulfitobacter sp. TaxID=191468 RepID=UPI002612535C|nr:LuxR C-terminal-related transcriptional regulator [uncultured Sulfitobacter sp.]
MPLDLARFENALADIHQRFQKKSDPLDSWVIAQGVAKEIGATAINLGGTNLEGDQPGWGRSSMSDGWLERYEDKKYHLVDPFIAALTAGQSEVLTDCGTLPRSDPAYDLNHDLKSYGYMSLYGTMYGSADNGYRSIVVYCSDKSIAEVQKEIGLPKLAIVHALIAAHTPRPNTSDGGGQFVVRIDPLSARETDVLRWLACGFRNDQIALKAGIAEVTVRKHLLSARRKLRASTREQAVAIAIRDGWITL